MSSLTSPKLAEVAGPSPQVEALLAAHHALMRAQSPAESCHVMTGEDLQAEGARVFALSEEDGHILAVGALKTVAEDAAPVSLAGCGPVVELKSMHVTAAARGRGLGHFLLSGMLDMARDAGAGGACLETGTDPVFEPARALYLSQGFVPCPPFGGYRFDPLSVFMCREL
ncbi:MULTISPECIES: GNAT family N-acetyltransferase [unclassified Mameliella]|uniref:GNAT family N-acetyltransferase n=1 Tax=unclassified Mameliella TaxID=2630630 RepID=UPI00273DF521|nr:MULTISPECIES: GNAT family N-acetyltransferase [unclassified Mameliella]